MLRGWFDSTFGDSALLAQVVIAIVLLVFILAMLVWLFGRRSGNGVSSSLVRGRQPRLSVMEAAVVDDKRRLVLVRRDQIEHLVMIGGPSDIVVETNIVRGRAAGHGQQGRRPTAAQRQQAPVTGAPPAPYPSQYPAPAPAHADQHSHQAPAAAETGHQIPPAAAAVAAASAAATAAAVLRRPTVADAAELEADTGNADDSDARPGTNGATRGISPFPGLPADRLAPAQAPSQDSAQTGQQAAQAEPADDVSIDLPPEFADELAAELASETSEAGDDEKSIAKGKDPAGSLAVAGLAAGAAALAAAAGSKKSDSEPKPAVAPEPVEEPTATPAPAVAAFQPPDMPAVSEATADTAPEEATLEEPASEAAPEPAAQFEQPQEQPDAAAITDADPFGNLESEFKKAFESSLNNLKTEAQPAADTPVAEDEASAFPETAETIPDTEAAETVAVAEDESPQAEPEPFEPELPAQTALHDEEAETAEAAETPAFEVPEFEPPAFETPAFETMESDADDDAGEETPAGPSRISDEIDLDYLEASLSEERAETEQPEASSLGPEATDHSVEAELADATTAEPEIAEPEIAEFETAPVEEAEPVAAEPEPVEPKPVEPKPVEREADMPEPAVAEADPETEAVAEVEPEPADLEAEIAAGAMAGAENAGSSTGLPPELAFLDTPAEAEEAAPEVEVEAETETEVAAELPEPEQAPELAPVAAKPINPFPTIPESVRKSVMAAASRAVPPELAGEFPDDTLSADEASADTANKDIATTTLGDLAQRLEKALTEQANPDKDAVASGEAELAEAEAGSEAEADDEEDVEGHDDGAVIDFSARRKEEPVDELEDEMARLLNDLTGDTGRAGK